MPRMKAFEGPLFPLETSQEKNISDIETLTTEVSGKITGLNDEMDNVNRVLHETHLGHEAHLWGQEVSGEAVIPEDD